MVGLGLLRGQHSVMTGVFKGISSSLRYLSLLTGTVFQVLLMDRSLLDDWLYDRVMLQLLATAGTVKKNERID